MEYALSYEAQQESFPGPVFKPTRRITQQEKRSWNLKNATTNAPARETTRQVLAELDIEYKEVYGKRNLTIAKEIRMNCGHKGQLHLVWVQIMIHQQTSDTYLNSSGSSLISRPCSALAGGKIIATAGLCSTGALWLTQ